MKAIFLLSCSLFLVAVTTAVGGMMAGGLTKHTDADELEQPIVDSALAEINAFFQRQNDNDARALVTKVMPFYTQVVAGVNHVVTLEVSGGQNGNEICEVTVFTPLFNDVGPANIATVTKCDRKN